ncbi:MAG: peptidyl-tRNA hydrolase Pth2 [Sulfolobales archaeon]|nr:peptidyl-tRNA hydrolase Pth2 [Sulfolobales archaeon]MDW8083123.1 peptidyl-tRNA hydrolase Pth2 [Sulfolobales archaeon]
MKQVIVVRTDLKMSRGKLAVQVAHAAVGAALEAMKTKPEWFSEWISGGQKKVVVKVSSEVEVFRHVEKAREAGIPAVIIQDAGLTELPPGTTTAAGLGPAPSEILDRITGRLKLL